MSTWTEKGSRDIAARRGAMRSAVDRGPRYTGAGQIAYSLHIVKAYVRLSSVSIGDRKRNRANALEPKEYLVPQLDIRSESSRFDREVDNV